MDSNNKNNRVSSISIYIDECMNSNSSLCRTIVRNLEFKVQCGSSEFYRTSARRTFYDLSFLYFSFI